MTWTTQSVGSGSGKPVRMQLQRGGNVASYADVVDALRSDDTFCVWFNTLLAGMSFSAFRWETPGVSAATTRREFEFVVLDSPGLARTPDPEAFTEHFARDSGEVLTFTNLGGDAMMVVPRPVGAHSAYGHLGAFVRGAPERQRTALWRAVGNAMAKRISDRPVWLSTAGGGVSWLHVRLDDRPKYYGYAPYRNS